MNMRQRAEYFTITIFLLLIHELFAFQPMPSERVTKLQAIKEKLLRGYDKTTPPFTKGKNSSFIIMHLFPNQILEVDEERSLFELDSDMLVSWEDSRLRWNDTEHRGDIELSPNLLWLPPIDIRNSLTVQPDPSRQGNIKVGPSGFVTWNPPLRTITSCPSISQAKASTDPYKVITCNLRIGFWMHDNWAIDAMKSDYLGLMSFLNINPRWELLVSQTKLMPDKMRSKEYRTLNTAFTIKRRPVPEIETTKKFCILVILLNLSIFWLPPNSSKKILLGGILLFALTQMFVGIALNTKYPLTSMFIVPFLQSTAYIVVFTLLFQVLVIFNLCQITSPQGPPVIVKRFLNGPFGKLACVFSNASTDTNSNIPNDVVQLHENISDDVISPKSPDGWMLVATALDRLCFVLTLIVVIAVHA